MRRTIGLRPIRLSRERRFSRTLADWAMMLRVAGELSRQRTPSYANSGDAVATQQSCFQGVGQRASGQAASSVQGLCPKAGADLSWVRPRTSPSPLCHNSTRSIRHALLSTSILVRAQARSSGAVPCPAVRRPRRAYRRKLPPRGQSGPTRVRRPVRSTSLSSPRCAPSDDSIFARPTHQMTRSYRAGSRPVTRASIRVVTREPLVWLTTSPVI